MITLGSSQADDLEVEGRSTIPQPQFPTDRVGVYMEKQAACLGHLPHR